MQKPLTELSSNALNAPRELSIASSDRVNCSLDILATIAHEHANPANKRRKVDFAASNLPENLCSSGFPSKYVIKQPEPAITNASDVLPPLVNRGINPRTEKDVGSKAQLLTPAEPVPNTDVGSPIRTFSQFDAIIEASTKTGLLSPPLVSAPFLKATSGSNIPASLMPADTEAVEKNAASVLLMASRNTAPHQRNHPSPSMIPQQISCEPSLTSDESQILSPPADGCELSTSPHREAYHERHLRLQQNQLYRQRLDKIGLRPIKKDSGKFHCSICDRGFNKEMFVWRHGVKHLGLKPFQCKDCLVTFGRSDSLQRHIRKFHKSSVDDCGMSSPCSKAFPFDSTVEHPSTP